MTQPYSPDPLADIKKKAEAAYARALAKGEKRLAAIFKNAAEQALEHANPAYFVHLTRLNKIPVPIDEFVQSKEFLGDVAELWPTLMPDLRAMNPDVMLGEDPVNVALLGGSTGTGKTFLGSFTMMYQIYLLTCFDEPQKLYNLSTNTVLAFMLQSVSTTVTKRVIYTPIRANFLAMPYVHKWVKYDKYKEADLVLEGHIHVIPAQATLQAMLGTAIPGALLDEINFMQVIDQSKQVSGPAGMGGYYDQAEIIARNIERRRKRSFLTKGISIGCIVESSSTRYTGDFLDRRIEEAVNNEETGVLWMRRKQYEVAPQERYAGTKFKVLIGTDTYPTQVLAEDAVVGRDYPEGAQIEEVPTEYRQEFVRDPEGSQRDIIGIASNAITPFIARREKIVDAVIRGQGIGLKPWVMKQNVELQTDGMPQILEANLPSDRKTPRFVHVDLSRTKDRCGIAITKIMGRQVVGREGGLQEVLPVFAVEAAITIQPSAMFELDPSEIRQWIMRLVQFYGFNIVSVSYDGFDSRESMLLFRKAGISSDHLSMDTTEEPYTDMRRALYDDRVYMVANDLVQAEFAQLEHNKKKGKVDHPPRGSKDGADAVTGSVRAAAGYRGAFGGLGVIDPQGNVVQTPRVKQRPTGMNRPKGRQIDI